MKQLLRGGFHLTQRIGVPGGIDMTQQGSNSRDLAPKDQDSKGRPRPEILYGRRKMAAWLRRNGFPEVSKHIVDRPMRDESMNGLIRGRKTRTIVSGKDGKRAGDLLNWNFSASASNRNWVTDFTYVPVYSGFIYVALVINPYSRAIVGWETFTVNDTAFVGQYLKMALWRRKHSNRSVDKAILHHSDYAEKNVIPKESCFAFSTVECP